MIQLSLAKPRGRITDYMNRAVIGPRLLVVDELWYLPFGREEANLFVHVIAKRYERSSTIVISILGAGTHPQTVERAFWGPPL